jgi:osmoprotectant transport system permease protein
MQHVKQAFPLICLAVMVVGLSIAGCESRKPRNTKEIRPGFNHEFMTRADGYDAVKRTYGFEFDTKPIVMDTSQMYEACHNGEVDVICGFSTDGLIDAYDLKILVDDQRAWPPYDACPLVRQDALAEHPEIREVLDDLGGKIDVATMQGLNLRVTKYGGSESYKKVARDFLVSSGLIEENAQPGSGQAGTISVGSKEFDEQKILGHMLAILLETRTDLQVERNIPLGGSTVAFDALLNGDIDMYVEYTGTGAVSILKNDQMAKAGSEEVYEYVTEQFPQRYNLVWMKPLGFANRYTLTMRKDHMEKFDIETISDLKELVEGN